MNRQGIFNRIVKGLAILMAVTFVLPSNTLAADPFAAQLVSATAPLTLKSGTEGTFEVVVKNTGTSTWVNSGANAVKVGTAGPIDRNSKFTHSSWLSNNRVVVAAETTVAPGDSAKFIIPVVAGAASGKVVEKFGLVMEGVAWAAFEFSLTINITPAVYGATLTSQQLTHLEMKAGESSSVTVTFKNTGDTAWTNVGASAVKIGTTSPMDRVSKFKTSGWLSGNRVISATNTVAAGGEGSFVFNVQAPSAPGIYKEEFGLVAEGITWFAPRFFIEIKVSPAIYSAQWVAQSGYPSLTPGGTADLWVEFKNVGNTTWKADGSTPVRLGTSRPLDRESQFFADSWINKNRVTAMTPSEVAPGQVAKFNFQVKAPNKVGTTKEYFRPVVDGVTWLEDHGVYWDMRVEEEFVIQDLVRIGLTATTDPIRVSGNGFAVRKGSGDRELVRRFNNEAVTVTPTSGGYRLSTGEQVNDYLRFVPVNGGVLTVETGGISSSYNTFRGVIVIQRSALGNVWVVNHLGLEDYMKGIAEVPESWHPEAQKAQVVAARTYGVKKRGESVASDIFDLYDDTRHQVYYGYDYEVNRPKLVTAVEATSRQVIKYQGQVISAYFFSDSGGATENSENVWQTALPYLKWRPDPYAKPIEWSATLTQSYLQQRFDQELRIASTDTIDKIEVVARFESQGVKTVRFTMKSGRAVDVNFDRFDYLTNNLDIKSMLISSINTVGTVSSPDFQFVGKGWGHRVGLAQWGAQNMAAQGHNHQQILTYYYTGVSVEPL